MGKTASLFLNWPALPLKSDLETETHVFSCLKIFGLIITSLFPTSILKPFEKTQKWKQ